MAEASLNTGVDLSKESARAYARVDRLESDLSQLKDRFHSSRDGSDTSLAGV